MTYLKTKENDKKPPLSRISVAPMMDWTDRHCRYFHRLLSPHTLLYTEMVTTGAIIHGERDRFLNFNAEEHPVALQLGGSNPDDLARCAEIGQTYGYDEINLNCGCPSDRVQNGRFGACLMKEPDHVAECMESMQKAVDIPVTIKCRIGVDDQDSLKNLDSFVSCVSNAGCRTFIIHARKAWLKGLSPKENRDVPPLDYERIQTLKKQYPDLNIVVNGGIQTVEEINTHLEYADGVMIGREAYQNPYLLLQIEQEIFRNTNPVSREEAVEAMIGYAERQYKDLGTPVKSVTRHILGLYHEQPGARTWRRTLSTLPYENGADHTVIQTALNMMKNPESRKEAA